MASKGATAVMLPRVHREIAPVHKNVDRHKHVMQPFSAHPLSTLRQRGTQADNKNMGSSTSNARKPQYYYKVVTQHPDEINEAFVGMLDNVIIGMDVGEAKPLRSTPNFLGPHVKRYRAQPSKIIANLQRDRQKQEAHLSAPVEFVPLPAASIESSKGPYHHLLTEALETHAELQSAREQQERELDALMYTVGRNVNPVDEARAKEAREVQWLDTTAWNSAAFEERIKQHKIRKKDPSEVPLENPPRYVATPTHEAYPGLDGAYAHSDSVLRAGDDEEEEETTGGHENDGSGHVHSRFSKTRMLPAILPAFAPAPLPVAVSMQKRVDHLYNTHERQAAPYASLRSASRRGRAGNNTKFVLASNGDNGGSGKTARHSPSPSSSSSSAPVHAVLSPRSRRRREAASEEVQLDLEVRKPLYTPRVPQKPNDKEPQEEEEAKEQQEQKEKLAFDFKTLLFPVSTAQMAFGQDWAGKERKKATTTVTTTKQTRKHVHARPSKPSQPQPAPPSSSGLPVREELFHAPLALKTLPGALPIRRVQPTSISRTKVFRHPKLVPTPLSARLLRDTHRAEQRKKHRVATARQVASRKKMAESAQTSYKSARAALGGPLLADFFAQTNATVSASTRPAHAASLLDSWYASVPRRE